MPTVTGIIIQETQSVDLFDITNFFSTLHTGWLGRRFWYYRSLNSTNRLVQDVAGDRLSHGLVCLTDHQSGGRGQFGRSWHSAPGENLTFTIVLKPQRINGLQLFSMAIMSELCETVRANINSDCIVKWPNDLLICGKKAAGLLTECRYNGKVPERVALGLGINVNQILFPEKIRNSATSLRMQNNGKEVDRAWFLAMLLNRLEPVFDSVEQGDDALIRNINRNILGFGRWNILIVNGKREKKPVKILGINESGYLTVLTMNDELHIYKHEQIRIEPHDS